MIRRITTINVLRRIALGLRASIAAVKYILSNAVTRTYRLTRILKVARRTLISEVRQVLRNG